MQRETDMIGQKILIITSVKIIQDGKANDGVDDDLKDDRSSAIVASFSPTGMLFLDLAFGSLITWSNSEGK